MVTNGGGSGLKFKKKLFQHGTTYEMKQNYFSG